MKLFFCRVVGLQKKNVSDFTLLFLICLLNLRCMQDCIQF